MSEGFYSQFEALHRGSTDSIKQRLAVYQPLLEALQHSFDTNVLGLDLGCGRGEWLAFAREQGLQMTGVDSDPDMLNQADGSLATLVIDDALEYLQQCPAHSFHLISAFHLIEHLPFDLLTTLLEQVSRVLAPGGILLLETPNPENPLIGSCYFYMDPTHKAPLPPALMDFAVQHYGFTAANIWRLNTPAEAEQRAPSMHTVFNGVSPDYAIVALKPNGPDDDALAAALQGPKGQTLLELATRYDNFMHESFEKQQGDTERLFNDLQRLAQGHENVSTAVADHQRVLDERQIENNHLRQQLMQQQQQFQQTLDHYASLIEVHEQKLRALTLPIAVMRPIHNLYVRRRDWIKQLSQSARTSLFYKWQAIKLLRLIGQKRLANKLAVKVGLTAFIPELQQGAATGPLDRTLPMAKIRQLSLQQRFQPSLNELKLAIDGHFSGSYSLASVNRQLALALAQQDHTQLSIRPREGAATEEIKDVPAAHEAALQALKQHLGECDITLYHHFPVVENPDPNSTPLLLFFWEESQIPAQTIEQINRCYRGVLVMSYLVRKALIDSGCQLPIAHIPMPLEDWRDDDLCAPADIKPRNLLHVSSCFPRKGVDVLLRAFDVLAARHPDLTLTIKTFPNPHNQCQHLIEQLLSPSHQQRVTLIEQDYSDEQMADLYRQASAVVLPSRGEGLNLPAIEACRYGVPVISTGYGAQTDFLADSQAELVNYHFSLSSSHVSSRDSLWVDPDVDDLVRACEASLTSLTTNLDLTPTRQAIYQRFYSPESRQQLGAAIQALGQFAASRPQPQHNQLTLISTWDERCGIAEYSRYQSDAMVAAGMDITVITTRRSPSDSPNNGRITQVSYEWATQSPMRLEILRDGDQPIWIQHHPSFFNLDEWLEQAIGAATRAGRLRLITLHTTLPLLQLPKPMAMQTARTLNQFYRVIVHTVDDLNNLRQLGVSDNLLFRPHGNVANPETLGELKPRSNTWKVGCFGFLFEHKGVLELIDAFAAFRQQQPDAHAELLLINSEHSNDESVRYRAKCQQRLKELELEDCTTFKYEFLPEEAVAHYLSQCDVLVMPYRETPESSSGAVRIAVANCQTVAVTPARIFSEVRDVTLPLAGFKSEHIEQLLLATWRGDNRAEITQCQQKRVQWLQAYSWEALAERHIELIKAAQIDLQWLSQ